MAAKKKGVATGHYDANGEAILVGDYVKALSTGRIYQVNKYGNLMNEAVGQAKFKVVGPVEIVSENDAIKAGARRYEEEATEEIVENNPNGEGAPVIDYDSIPEASAIIEPAEEEAPAVASNPEGLKAYTDDELLAELRARNYSGDLRQTIICYRNVTL